MWHWMVLAVVGAAQCGSVTLNTQGRKIFWLQASYTLPSCKNPFCPNTQINEAVFLSNEDWKWSLYYEVNACTSKPVTRGSSIPRGVTGMPGTQRVIRVRVQYNEEVPSTNNATLILNPSSFGMADWNCTEPLHLADPCPVPPTPVFSPTAPTTVPAGYIPCGQVSLQAPGPATFFLVAVYNMPIRSTCPDEQVCAGGICSPCPIGVFEQVSFQGPPKPSWIQTTCMAVFDVLCNHDGCTNETKPVPVEDGICCYSFPSPRRAICASGLAEGWHLTVDGACSTSTSIGEDDMTSNGRPRNSVSGQQMEVRVQVDYTAAVPSSQEVVFNIEGTGAECTHRLQRTESCTDPFPPITPTSLTPLPTAVLAPTATPTLLTPLPTTPTALTTPTAIVPTSITPAPTRIETTTPSSGSTASPSQSYSTVPTKSKVLPATTEPLFIPLVVGGAGLLVLIVAGAIIFRHRKRKAGTPLLDQQYSALNHRGT